MVHIKDDMFRQISTFHLQVFFYFVKHNFYGYTKTLTSKCRVKSNPAAVK